MLELLLCYHREREEKEREKKERKKEKKSKENAPERKFGGTNQISFFREIFLSQGERERERDPSISTRDLHKYTRHRGNI